MASSMKVAELRAELTKLGLDSKGLKAALVSRLEAAQASASTAKKPAAKKAAPKRGKAAAKKATPKAASKAAASSKPKASPASSASSAPKAKAAASSGPKKAKKDKLCSFGESVLVENGVCYDAMLNQTNIGANNNKFYVIQVVQNSAGSAFRCFTRWGRVGEGGQQALLGGGGKDQAISLFKKKFKDKSRNDWDRVQAGEEFVPFPKKYHLLEMANDEDEDSELEDVLRKLDGRPRPASKTEYAESTLPGEVVSLVDLIFDQTTHQHAMAELGLDVKRMPLGKLSDKQIQKGYAIVSKIEAELKKKSRSSQKLQAFSSEFYTAIPHAFSRSQVPPVINTAEGVQQKFDMLAVLEDVTKAQELLKQKEDRDGVVADPEEPEIVREPHPADGKYATLDCDLEPLAKSAPEWDIIEKYVYSAYDGQKGHGWGVFGRKPKQLLHVFEVDRKSESKRFQEHDALGNRKLLWHGTNVAVVAAILKGGLRIMPHSGGRVGRGLYFASENSKSAAYVRTAPDGTGIMFLAEVALGKPHSIVRDDHTLVRAPAGHHSVIAQGHTEPDSSASIVLDGKSVEVPFGTPKLRPEFHSSTFSQSEYLVYAESQVRIRYMLVLKLR